MSLKAARCICVVAAVLFVAGCDMETLVKTKVPEPLKNLLSFGPTGPKPAKGPGGAPLPPKAEIEQPAPNSVHAAGKEVLFRGTAEVPGQPAAKPDLTWTLFKDKDKQGTLLGKALSAKKALEAGEYRAEFAMTVEGQRVAKSVRFRVVYSVPGKVLAPDGKGLSGTEIILSSLDQQAEIFRTSSGPDGRFSVELPPEGHFLLAPRKKGFSFNPYHKIIQYQKDSAPAEFTSVKGEIKDIRFTSSADSDDVLTSLCPNQLACIKFEMESPEKPDHIEAFLSRIVSNAEDLTQLDHVKGTGDSATDVGSPGRRALAVKVPTDLHIGSKEVSYRVLLKVRDQKGSTLSAQAPAAVKVDLPQCLNTSLTEAVSLHLKGELQAAAKAYTQIEEVNKKLEDRAAFVSFMEKVHFDRAVAYIAMARALPEDDPKRREYLGKALSDLTSVLKVRKKDVQALLLRGITKQLMGDPESSLEDFSAALGIEPKGVAVLEYKVRSLLKTKKKKNLVRAVDDLTEAIDLEPGSKHLRKIRSETLKLLAKSQDMGDDATIDTSGAPLGEIARLTLENYLRK
jgi:tetratricopeptide (TPR) repeat protein